MVYNFITTREKIEAFCYDHKFILRMSEGQNPILKRVMNDNIRCKYFLYLKKVGRKEWLRLKQLQGLVFI